VPAYLDKAHISGGSLSYEDEGYLRPVESDVGSFKFHPPPSYSASLSRKNPDDDVFQRTSSDRSSERYVSDSRFNDDDNQKLLSDSKDLSDGASDQSIEPNAKVSRFIHILSPIYIYI